MHPSTTFHNDTNFALKYFPINVILFFLIPFIIITKIILHLNVYVIIKGFLIYWIGLSVPLLFLYLSTCTSLLLGDIIQKNKLQNFSYYYL